MKQRRSRMALLTVLLLSALLLPLLPLTAFAYGETDQKLIITHINSTNSTEGSAIIIAGSHTDTLGTKGNFAWWSVYIFDWDAEQSCFVLTEKNTQSNNVDKSAMQIPEYGFAYCICVGNDYSASGGINYITDRIKNSNAYAATLEVGTKAYLYGTRLAAGVISDNGKLWYASDYVSNAYLQIGAPVEGEQAYDPVASAGELVQYRITPNYVNSNHYASGDCILFTPDRGSYVSGDYSWWYSLMFSWDASENSYVCTALDVGAATGYIKNPVIPENGFVIMDCGSSSKNSVLACSVGAQAWLYRDGDSYLICVNAPEEGLTPVTPDGADSQYDAPVINNVASAGATTKCTDTGFTVQWDAVAGASSYTIAVNTSTPNTFNKLIVPPTVVNGTSFEIPAGLMATGNAYTITLYANSGSKCASPAVTARLYCISETAMNSALSNKLIVAFGDSLTARSGWVSMLGGYIGNEVINSGVGGDSTYQGIARFQADVLDYEPDIALICFGMNDQAQVISSGRPNVSLEAYTANMIKFVTELQAIGTDVVLICPHDAYAASGYYTPGSYGLDYAYGNMKDFCEAIRQIAIEYGCGLIDIYAETQSVNMSTFLNAGDGIHQSTEGHTLWAKYVSSYLLAKYDGVNAATISVTCEDQDGNTLASYSLTAAIGSAMIVPAKTIEGKTLVGEETLQTITGDTEITYTYQTPAAGLRGDIDGDGSLHAKDYMKLKRHILGTYNLTEEEYARADVDQNGKVEAKDYMMLKRVILGTYQFPEA